MPQPFVFGAWLRTLRRRLALSRQAVANRAGGRLSQQYIHFIESGKATNIGSEKLAALADGLGVPLEILHQALVSRSEPVIPVLGRVAAGLAVHASDGDYGETQPYLDVSAALLSFEVLGDSMSPRLDHGDLVIAEPLSPEHAYYTGRLYVFRHGRKITCKYLVEDAEQPGVYWIEAENEALFARTRLTPEFQVLGRVIEVRKTTSLFRPFNP